MHRCGVISAESRAAQNDYDDIAEAVAELHELLDDDHAWPATRAGLVW